MGKKDTLRIPAERLTELIKLIFLHLHVPVEDAEIVSSILVDADLRGVETHGSALVPLYARKIKANSINPQVHLRILRETPNTLLIDGDNGLGQLVAFRSMQMCLEKATSHDVGIACVQNANHAGCMGYYSSMAAAEGFVGFTTTTAARNMAPWGGVSPLLGNNPFALAVPAEAGSCIVLDMAASVVSKGKIRKAANKGQTIPKGWVVSSTGQPITDPRIVVEVSGEPCLLVPIGGYKGSGIALMNSVLAGVLSGTENNGLDIPSLSKTFAQRTEIGLFLTAVKIEAFMPLEEFRSRIARFRQMIKSSRLAPNKKEILLPGERSARIKARRIRNGIPIPASLWEMLFKLESE